MRFRFRGGCKNAATDQFTLHVTCMGKIPIFSKITKYPIDPASDTTLPPTIFLEIPFITYVLGVILSFPS